MNLFVTIKLLEGWKEEEVIWKGSRQDHRKEKAREGGEGEQQGEEEEGEERGEGEQLVQLQLHHRHRR